MTFIHPNRQNFFIHLVLFGMIALVTASVILLIVLYNQTVGLAHGADTMRATAKQIETENSELKGKIFALFTPDAAALEAAHEGLTPDTKPQYSSIDPEWVVASSRSSR